MEKDKKRTNGNPLIAAVSTLADLITYQEGSVVSRTLIDKNAGTVTLFAFTEGQGLSEHTAPFDALVLVYEGQAEITIAGKLLHLKEGDCTIMPANKPHALKAVERFKMLLVMIKS
jgi:quercetin dioxygenase-like cupin family protein